MSFQKADAYGRILVVLQGEGKSQELKRTVGSLRGESLDLICIAEDFADLPHGVTPLSPEQTAKEEWEYCFFLVSGDEIVDGSMTGVWDILQEKNPDLVYTDIILNLGDCEERIYKPDYSPDLLCSENYIGSRVIVSRQLLETLGIQIGRVFLDYNHVLRLAETAKCIEHLREAAIVIKEIDTENEQSEMHALQQHLIRVGLKGTVQKGCFDGTYHIRYDIAGTPLVSILIPNYEHLEDLISCIDSIRTVSTWPNWEIVIIENNSSDPKTFKGYKELLKDKRIHLIRYEGSFNYAAIMNLGVQYCQGEYIIQLNNDTKIISPEWIEEMLMLCQRKDVGVVGAMLYYPDNTVQHAGAVMIWQQQENIAAVSHAYKGYPRGEKGEMNRMGVIQNYSAVTGACMMIRKKVWQEADGMDENFAVAYNDIDLCLRLRNAGYVNVWTPYAELYHMESKTRTIDLSQKQIETATREVRLFSEKYNGMIRNGDPYGPPISAEDFVLRGQIQAHKEPTVYIPGIELDFSKNKNTAAFYEQYGFWEAEAQYTWTAGKKAGLLFRIPETRRDLIVRFSAFPFYRPQRMKIFVNGQELGILIVDQDKNYSFKIPHEIVSETVSLEIDLPDAQLISGVLGGNDKRCVGIAMKSMKIEEMSGSEVVQNLSKEITIVNSSERDKIQERIFSNDHSFYEGDSRIISLGISELRQNLLRWYPFRKNSRILEVFGGYGALTELLLEKGDAVTVIEPDPAKAYIIRERFLGNDHLTVLDDIGKLGKEAIFDYVIRVESELEDSHYYKDALDKIWWSDYLKSDGRFLWGLYNRLSINHFSAGNREILSGETAKRSDMSYVYCPLTKKEAEKACKDQGIAVLKWYYPYPDQCFTYEVFSDESINRRVPETDMFPNDENEVVFYDPIQTRKLMMNEGLGDIFSQAFFIEAGLVNERPESAEMDYIRISANRTRDKAICTAINYEGAIVTKWACYREGREHIQRVRSIEWQRGILYSVATRKEYEDAVVTPLFLSRSLLEQMLDLANHGQKDAFWAYLIQLKAILYSGEKRVCKNERKFTSVFGASELHTAMHWIAKISIDLVPNNIFPIKDRWIVIDNEWVFDFAIPGEYILWRSVLYLFSQNDLKEMLKDRNLLEFLEIDETSVSVFETWEHCFQTKYVGVNQIPRPVMTLVNMDDLNTDFQKKVEEKCLRLGEIETELQKLSNTKSFRFARKLLNMKRFLRRQKYQDAISETQNRLKECITRKE